MTSFFEDFASLGSQFFRDKQGLQNPEQQLQGIGVDTQKIDQKVEQDLQASQEKFLSIDRQRELLSNVPEGVNKMDVVSDWVQKGYTVEGLDSTAVAQQAEQPTQANIQKETPDTAIGALAEGIGEKTPGLISSTIEGGENILGGAISQAPTIVGNVAGFIADVADFVSPIDNIIEAVTGAEEGTTLFDLGGLADQFRADGIESKEQLQEIFGTDPEAVTTQIGEFGAEIGSLFIPGGQTALAAKLPALATKIPGAMKLLEKFSTKAPKAFNIFKSAVAQLKDPEKLKVLKSAATGATEAAKFGIVAEGEITPTGVAIGAVANPVFQKAGTVIKGLFKKDVQGGLASIISPGKKKGVSTDAIKGDLDSIAATIKGRNLKPSNLEELYKGLSKSLDDIYTKGIKPKLEAAGDSVVNMNTVVDDVFKKLSTSGKIAGKDIHALTGKGGELEALKPLLKVWKTGKTDILQVEKLKQLSSALVRESGAGAKDPLLNSVQVEFFTKLNTALQNNIDDVLTKAGGEGVKALKTEYGAIARQLPALDSKILRELKKEGVSLFEGLGIISGIKDIASGNIRSGTSSILTGKILNLLKDPDEILKRVIKQIHGPAATSVAPKVIGIGSSAIGQELDERQRNK